MTATDDPVRLFRDAIPPHLRAHLHDTQRIVALITKAANRGWTTDALTREATRDLTGTVNPGGVITSRLDHCAEHDPPIKPAKRRPEWCGTCDPTTRHVLDENRLPGTARCPNCHPLSQAVTT